MRKGSFLVICLVAALVTAGVAFAQAEGAKAYAKCTACHKENGQGTPGVFPPLAGHAPEIAKAPGGREYMINVVLYGLKGEIKIGGKTYTASMAPLGTLTDAEVAAALNHALKSWGNDKLLPAGFKEIGAAEVKKAREKKMTAADVYSARGKLGLK